MPVIDRGNYCRLSPQVEDTNYQYGQYGKMANRAQITLKALFVFWLNGHWIHTTRQRQICMNR